MSNEADRPKPASTVLLVRDVAAGLEVLMVRRSAGMAFGASAWVFPGGKVAAADADPAWDELSDGTYDHYARSLRIAAAREVFEESGLLLATRGGEELDAAGSVAFDEQRARVEADPTVFIQLIRDAGLRLTLDFDAFLGLDGLMQPIAPATARHQTARIFIDDDDLVLLHDVLNVALVQAVGLDRKSVV